MTKMSTPHRCRIVLITPTPGPDVAPKLQAALSGGDVASLIIPAYGLDDSNFQDYAESLTRIAQQENVAVVIAGEPRIASRVHADGIHIEGSIDDVVDAIEKYQSKMTIGCGDVKTRDDAMLLGEAEPDYIFFGKFGYDNKPEPHPRNLSLGEWWAELMQIPCIVLAGSSMESALDVAMTGADFVALSAAVFGEGVDAAKVIAETNILLDSSAPQFRL